MGRNWSLLLKDEKGRIFENIWQFSKVYEKVPKSIQTYSRFNKTVIWNHPAEIHLKEGLLTPEYYQWRTKGMLNPYAIRYPVGYNHRHKCLYALAEKSNGTIDPNEKLDYIQSRKEIYVQEYCRLVKKEPKFQELQNRLKKGENLLIIEVDGPHEESLDYYKSKYGVNNHFIETDTMLVNKKNIEIMLNDSKHAFGHGYCLAMALLDMD